MSYVDVMCHGCGVDAMDVMQRCHGQCVCCRCIGCDLNVMFHRRDVDVLRNDERDVDARDVM